MKFFGSSSASIWLALASTVSMGVSQADNETAAPTEALFDGCDPDVYYASLLQENSDPTTWTRDALMTLVKTTHQNILPTNGDTAEDDDIYKAIIDLDPGNHSNTVWLVYRDMDAADYPNGNPLYWDVERLYPMDRGYDALSPAYTDVHNMRPAKSTVLMVKGNLSFGMCDTVEYPDVCVTPATDETANDTSQDGKIWTPPERFRGEIARALFYMDLRYERLSLQDCGPFTHAMGYLSQMLEWNEMYPVTEREIRRNDQACARWQGNRNPFIDFPELAQILHGPPEQILEGTRTYPTCIESFPTQAPTATRNDCGMVRRGDVPIFLVNSDDPDEVVFLPLFDLPGNMELYLTDKAWNGTDLIDGVANEGTMVMTTPEDGIQQGALFGYGPGTDHGGDWQIESGSFSLSTDAGDNVFLYCIDADNKTKFLAGFSNTGNWSEPGLTPEAYGESMSALPDMLLTSSIVLPHMDNYFYNGSREETINLLRADMLNPASWVGNDENRFGVENSNLNSGSSLQAAGTFSVVLSSLVLFLFA